jgi:hypothetical protein
VTASANSIDQGEDENMGNPNRENDEMDRRLGGSGREDEGYGQQAPGRGQDGDQLADQTENTRIGEDEDSDSGREE